jgi:hypothetical protein
MTSIQTELALLARRVEATTPGATVDFEAFPSGAGWIDVSLDGHLYQMVYMPSDQLYGVDELLEEDPPFSMHFRFCTPAFEPAAERLWALVRGEIKVSASDAA